MIMCIVHAGLMIGYRKVKVYQTGVDHDMETTRSDRAGNDRTETAS